MKSWAVKTLLILILSVGKVYSPGIKSTALFRAQKNRDAQRKIIKSVIPNFHGPILELPIHLPAPRVPKNESELTVEVHKLIGWKESWFKIPEEEVFLFPAVPPLVEFESNGEKFPINPDSGIYGLTHLKYLFAIDGTGRDKEHGFNSSTGLFKITMNTLKRFLRVENLQFQYTACRTQGGKECWLNTLINAARLVNPTLPFLNNTEYQKFIIFIAAQSGKVGVLDGMRYKRIVQSMTTAIDSLQGWHAQGFAFVLSRVLKYLNIFDPSYKSLTVQQKLYLQTMKKMLNQCPQMPKIRLSKEFNAQESLFLCISDDLHPSEDGEFQSITPALRIDPSQAISKENWQLFLSKQPLVTTLTVSHNFNGNIEAHRSCPEHKRSEDPHVVAARLQIKIIEGKRTLVIEIANSLAGTSNPVGHPSIVPTLCMLLANLAKYAKVDGSGLMTERALIEHSKELKTHATLGDKVFPGGDKLMDKIANLYRLFGYEANLNKYCLDQDEIKELYLELLSFLKHVFAELPDGKRFLYAKKCFINLSALGWIKFASPEALAQVFTIGLGLSKEEVDYIDAVYHWQEDPEMASSLQMEFVTNKSFIVAEPLIIHGPKWKDRKDCAERRKKDSTKYAEPLEECETCSDYQQQMDRALDRDSTRYLQWFRKPEVD